MMWYDHYLTLRLFTLSTTVAIINPNCLANYDLIAPVTGHAAGIRAIISLRVSMLDRIGYRPIIWSQFHASLPGLLRRVLRMSTPDCTHDV